MPNRKNYKWNRNHDDRLSGSHNRFHGVRHEENNRKGPAVIDVYKRAIARNLLPTPSGNIQPGQGPGLVSGETWIRITVLYAASHLPQTIQEHINEVLGTHLKFYNVFPEGRNLILHAKARSKQLPNLRKSLGKLRDPLNPTNTLVADLLAVGEPKIPSLPSGQAGVANLPSAWVEALGQCFRQRFQESSRSLDLSSLHNDHSLLNLGLFLPLNRPPVVRAMITLLKQNAAQLTTLNLSSNRLNQLNAFSPLSAIESIGSLPPIRIECIDLSANPLTGLPSLASLRGIPGLVELDVSETPLASLFRTNIENSTVVKLNKMVPGLKKINGKELPQIAQFAIEREGGDSSSIKPLPQSNLGYFPSDQVKDGALAFIKKYFELYDQPSRGEKLLSYYLANSQLAYSTNPEVRLNTSGQHSSASYTDASSGGVKTVLCCDRLTPTHYHGSRNLARVRDPSQRLRLVQHGRVAIAALLDGLPRTQHLLESFKLDVPLHTDSQMVFTFSGLFYELVGSPPRQGTGSSSKTSKVVRKVLRCFSRTFIVIAPNGHIVQEDFVLSNPSLAMAKLYITQAAERMQLASNDAAVHPTTNAVDQISLSASSAGVDQVATLAQFRATTGMNEAYSHQCLTECGWDVGRALQAFESVRSKLPVEAFV